LLLPMLQSVTRNFDVVEVEHSLADELIRLVSLSGDQHDIPRSRLGNRTLDSAPPVQLDGHGRLRTASGDDFGGNGAGIFAARVVARNDDAVG
jgi:hypothetical protein